MKDYDHGASSGAAFIFLIYFLYSWQGLLSAAAVSLRVDSKAPVIDSNMSKEKAFDSLNPGVLTRLPEAEARQCQILLVR